ncbi:formate dehydrogenase accessory sulfurtransferase FdhD [Deinococcus irradiatisoli]|uniref:Sulfur carrier protein FdhD n=1 Tax=Deinococcus irradiatisoli TaxID=2202254 RepID=A0A2Z3JHD4_9DEIO|nr:formate dehydrogenase accessory sulfurtransferase FdhD [Deinococcus irradiatisoli]
MWTYRSGQAQETQDVLAVEEPLELRVLEEGGDFALAVTMRTPGQDESLTRGWLHAEGLLPFVDSLHGDPDQPNVLWLRGDAAALRHRARAGVTSSACGVCGSGSVERLSLRVLPPRWTAPPLPPEQIVALPQRLRDVQPGFAATGGLHAAGLFTAEGGLLCAFEDVGRHNAVDKVVGWAAERGQLPLSDRLLVTSSRAGFEIVQKAALAGAAVVITVGAASSLAVDTAAALNLTLVGFVRGERFNVYAGPERIAK